MRETNVVKSISYHGTTEEMISFDVRLQGFSFYYFGYSFYLFLHWEERRPRSGDSGIEQYFVYFSPALLLPRNTCNVPPVLNALLLLGLSRESCRSRGGEFSLQSHSRCCFDSHSNSFRSPSTPLLSCSSRYPQILPSGSHFRRMPISLAAASSLQNLVLRCRKSASPR